MSPLLERLLASAPVVLDGAWGTELQARGLALGECPDAWNLSHPDRVEAVARAYVEAGSDVILTNTFRSNRIALADTELEARAREMSRAGVEISRRAAAGRARIFASMGPSGKLLAAGDVDERALQEAFAEQARALAEGGADAIVIETMSDPAEAAIAVRAARETGLPVVACMTFDSGANFDRTMMGTTVEAAMHALVEAGADVIGANCGVGIAGYVPICQRLHAATERPIWIKANAGLPEVVDGKIVYRTTPQAFAAYARPLLEAGASFLGGCCGTNPDFIRALSQEIGGLGPR